MISLCIMISTILTLFCFPTNAYDVSGESVVNAFEQTENVIYLRNEIVSEVGNPITLIVETEEVLSVNEIGAEKREEVVRTSMYSLDYDGSREDVGSDHSGSVVMSVRGFFDRITYSNDTPYISITNVQCSVSAPSPIRIRIQDADLLVGQMGMTYGGGYRSFSNTYYPLGNGVTPSGGGSYSVTPPTSWLPVFEGEPSSVGATLTLTLTNLADGTLWDGSVTCSLIG